MLLAGTAIGLLVGGAVAHRPQHQGQKKFKNQG
jgi:hypothetical protein